MIPPISVCVVTFNEEDNIRRLLASVKWAAEIIVVDSFSTDRTVEIARELGAKVTQRAWPGHIEQKTFALSLATNEWVFCLDADEEVTPKLKDEMFKRLESDAGAIDGYSVKRHTFYLGSWIDHGGWYPDRKLRLFKKDKARIAGENPHDRYFVDGVTVPLDADINHFTYKDLAHQIKTINFFSDVSVQESLKKGEKGGLLCMLLKPPLKFLETYFYKLGFLDGVPGLVISIMTSYYAFVKCAKLWEKSRTQ